VTPDARRDDVPVLLDEPWTTRYEEMRREVMAKSFTMEHAYGYAILIRRGLVAWMKAWAQPAPEPSRDLGLGRAVDGVTVPSHLLRSAASLLANMIFTLDAQTEVPP